jgi:GNAT superfamily N-acetyltransferase
MGCLMEGVSTEEFSIRAASTDDADVIGTLVACLLGELYPDLQDLYRVETLIPVTRDLLRSANVFGMVAINPAGETVGVLMLNQCEAIYAFGRFGEISELYIDPRHRSSGLGAALLQAAVSLARSQNWSMLEVGAPDVPRWQKTVDFYTRNGFLNVGPRLYLPLN